MKLLTLDSPSGPTAGAMLESGEVVNFARAAKANSVEAWLPPRLTDILKAGPEGLAVTRALVERVPGITLTRPVDGGVELHVKGKDRLLPKVVTGAEDAGFPVLDISVTEPTLETVFIKLTGKELRD